MNCNPGTKRLSFVAFFFASFFLFQNNKVSAQDGLAVAKQKPLHKKSSPEFKPLTIGDKVPDIEFTMINYSRPRAWLSDFRGRLVILDFWATWCAACISKFPKLDSLQDVFGDKLQILLVNSINTGDNETKVQEFYKKRMNKNGKPYQLITAIGDSLANLFFPHRTVPHYAWITPEGRVKAITSSKEITVENIQKILEDEAIAMPVKKDFFPNKLMDLGSGGDQLSIDDNLMYYSIFKKGQLKDLTNVNQLRLVKNPDSRGYNIRGKAMRNLPLLDMYKAAIALNKEFRKVYNDKRFILDVKDSSKLIFDPAEMDIEQWEKDNLYTYDLVVPTKSVDNLYEYMIRDLNQYSGYYGRIEKRKMECFVLTLRDKGERIATKGGKSEYRLYNNQEKRHMNNMPISRLVSGLDRMTNIKLPVIDETAYRGKIDIELDVDLGNVEALKDALQQYGLNLQETERELEVFVLSENK